MMRITIDGLVAFNASDVWLTLEGRKAVRRDPTKVMEAIQEAVSYMDNPHVVAAHMSGVGRLYEDLDFDQFLRLLGEIEIAARRQASAFKAKIEATVLRRRGFNKDRPELVLQMIEAGVPVVCAAEGCDIDHDLEVDHIVPLSRGGTDTLSNLQFLCRSHNAQKSDKL